jgi:hypothetical protein
MDSGQERYFEEEKTYPETLLPKSIEENEPL